MNQKRRLLIVEDEEAIRSGLIDVFVYHGYVVESASDGKEGLTLAKSSHFDLVLLDVMLPSMSGFDICNEIRKVDREQPIIMLTAKVGDEDIVNGLKIGADDYIGKPFGVQELVLRVEAVLRRTAPVRDDERHLDLGKGLTIDTVNLDGMNGGSQIVFTRREIEIIQILHANSDRPMSREELLSEVWGYRRELQIETRTVDIHIAKLRRKIEQRPKIPQRLVKIRGAGYRLKMD
ncbi:MAG: DNA-binding response OmpR family regulator [Gammaproteobacteria bacterium]|jgi:DNA-binding response OmpR family regulator